MNLSMRNLVVLPSFSGTICHFGISTLLLCANIDRYWKYRIYVLLIQCSERQFWKVIPTAHLVLQFEGLLFWLYIFCQQTSFLWLISSAFWEPNSFWIVEICTFFSDLDSIWNFGSNETRNAMLASIFQIFDHI